MRKMDFRILSTMVTLGIVLTLLTLLALPLFLTAVLKISNLELTVAPSTMAFWLSACIYACAIPYVIALFKLSSICKLLARDNPFDRKISRDFDVISRCAFSEAVVFGAATLLSVLAFGLYLYAFTILSIVVVTFISVTAGFLFKIISGVFKRAAEIQEDNDLTF